MARSYLTYHDRSIDFQIQTHKRRLNWKLRDADGWSEHLAQLKSQSKKVLLTENDYEDPSTYSGIAEELSVVLGHLPVVRQVSYPEAKQLAWSQKPKHPSRPFQQEMKEALLQAKHAAVSVGTGLGKSRVILELCHDLGLRAVVMAPSRSIASQLLREFQHHLGYRLVGMYGDSKKQLKQITIGIAASLTKVLRGSEAWKWFSESQVFIADECHLTPAATVESVCTGLLAKAPYRFFFTATHMRGDGSEMLLKGITGPVVYEKTVEQGVDEGWLARPNFRMVRIPSGIDFDHQDVNRMTQKHLLYNKNILDKACQLANMSVKLLGHQVVVLVDELEQFPLIHSRLKYPCRFAHGQDGTQTAKQKLPAEYQRSNPTALVDQFNSREFPILVGTSCIGTGTDVRAAETIIYLQGGKSEIQVSQAVGRGTRGGPRGVGVPTKSGSQKLTCNFIDFAPILSTSRFDDAGTGDRKSPVYRHAVARAEIYASIYPSVQWVDG
jgi:superfamily II DNA or RNA helicase